MLKGQSGFRLAFFAEFCLFELSKAERVSIRILEPGHFCPARRIPNSSLILIGQAIMLEPHALPF